MGEIALALMRVSVEASNLKAAANLSGANARILFEDGDVDRPLALQQAVNPLSGVQIVVALTDGGTVLRDC